MEFVSTSAHRIKESRTHLVPSHMAIYRAVHVLLESGWADCGVNKFNVFAVLFQKLIALVLLINISRNRIFDVVSLGRKLGVLVNSTIGRKIELVFLHGFKALLIAARVTSLNLVFE